MRHFLAHVITDCVTFYHIELGIQLGVKFQEAVGRSSIRHDAKSRIKETAIQVSQPM